MVGIECEVWPLPLGDWVEEYHLVPGTGVMANAADLDV